MKVLNKIYTLFRYYPSGKIKKLFRYRLAAPTHVPGLNKKVLFSPFAPHRVNILRESIWAHACRLRGAKVKMISYDLFLPAIDFLSPGVIKDLPVTYRLNKRLYRLIDLPLVHLSRYFNRTTLPETTSLNADQIIDLKHKNISLGDLVIASTIRYYFCNGPEWDNPDFLSKAREFACSAIVLTDIFIRLLEEEKPDKVVLSHGIYVSWGTLFRAARQLGIPVDVYGSSYRKDTLRFYHNTPNAPFPDGEWDHFKEKDLSPDELRQLDKYIETRATQSDDAVTLFSEKDNFPDSLKVFLEKAKTGRKKIYCLFTNISWDAYMFRKDSATFNNMIEWVNETISFFKSDTHAFLIVKAHPSEAYFKIPERYRIATLIDKNLPDNILFIDEKADVKPDLLYKYIDIGLIYTSTVSIEMALKNIPVLTAGVGGHYSNKGFTIDPVSKSEYFEKIVDLNSDKFTYLPDIKMAKKYLYFRFFREALRNDLLMVEKYIVKRYNFNSLEDLFPEKNRELDIICDGILNNAKFINS